MQSAPMLALVTVCREHGQDASRPKTRAAAEPHCANRIWNIPATPPAELSKLWTPRTSIWGLTAAQDVSHMEF